MLALKPHCQASTQQQLLKVLNAMAESRMAHRRIALSPHHHAIITSSSRTPCLHRPT